MSEQEPSVIPQPSLLENKNEHSFSTIFSDYLAKSLLERDREFEQQITLARRIHLVQNNLFTMECTNTYNYLMTRVEEALSAKELLSIRITGICTTVNISAQNWCCQNKVKSDAIQVIMLLLQNKGLKPTLSLYPNSDYDVELSCNCA
jgi:hypothetical protein